MLLRFNLGAFAVQPLGPGHAGAVRLARQDSVVAGSGDDVCTCRPRCIVQTVPTTCLARYLGIIWEAEDVGLANRRIPLLEIHLGSIGAYV